jgi:AcrR family transcriptional regulator
MAPQSKTQLARARTLKREHLIAAATRAFASHGYVGATTKRLAEEAGVSEGLFYHYFPSKRRLMAVIRDRVFADVRGAIALDRRVTRGRCAEQVVRGLLASFRRHRDFWRLALLNRGEAAVRATLEPEMIRLGGEVQRALQHALERDGARKPKIESELLFATIDGVTQRFVSQKDYPIDAVTEALVRRLGRSG